LYIGASPYNTVTGNQINYNSNWGIYLDDSESSFLTGNRLSGNNVNLKVGGSQDNFYKQSIDTSNTVEGKPVYYVQDATGTTYGNETNAGVFYCINCTDVVIEDLVLSSNNDYGIYLRNALHSTVQNNIIRGASQGIRLYNSEYNQLLNNHVSNNDNGIILSAGWRTEISGNIVNYNDAQGIGLGGSPYNKIHHNIVRMNGTGTSLYDSTFNEIYSNYFVDNLEQAIISGPASIANMFNLPLPTGGNYWSGWTSPDNNSDGIVDSPFIFSGGQDDLPLAAPADCNEPVLRISYADAYWPSMSAYAARHLSVDYHIDSFFDVYWDLDVEGTQSTNGVIGIGLSELGPLDVMINSTSPNFTYKYSVPDGVVSFKTTIYTTAQDSCGNTYEYPGPWPGA